MSYLKKVLIGFDQFVNTLLFGMPDETLSSRAYRNSKRYWYAKVMRFVIDCLFFVFERNHCKNSYESEKMRSQFPNELR